MGARKNPPKNRPPPNRNAKTRLKRAKQTKSAVDLALEGMSVRRIAAAIGVSKSTVQTLLDEAYEDARPGPEQTEAYRREQRARIMRQLEAWIPRSLNENDAAAARAVARFEERLAKLDGIDTAAQEEVAGPAAPINISITPQQTSPTALDVSRLVREAFGGHAAVSTYGGTSTPAPEPGTGPLPPNTAT